MSKVPRLFSIAADCNPSALQERGDEERNDGCILRSEILTGAENIEIAKAYRLQTVDLGDI